MATAHLICGPVGAGKTTRARELTLAHRGVPFVLDDWLTTLYGPEMPQPLVMDWAWPRISRCEQQIWKLAWRCLGLGVDVILDLGFMRREQRDHYRGLVVAAGATPLLHVVDAPAAIRRERVRARNASRAGTFTVEVTDSLFDEAETWWQPLGEDEAHSA